MFDLRNFMRGLAARRFQLGEHDCGLMLADWVKLTTGLDPAAPVRGSYECNADLARIAPRGLPRLFDRLLRGAGMRRTRSPAAFDVAIVTVGCSDPRGALRIDRGFILIASGGVTCELPARVRVIMGWTFRDA